MGESLENIHFTKDLLPWGIKKYEADLFLNSLLSIKAELSDSHLTNNKEEIYKNILETTNSKQYFESKGKIPIIDIVIEIMEEYYTFIMTNFIEELKEVLKYDDYNPTFLTLSEEERQKYKDEKDYIGYKKTNLLHWLLEETGGTRYPKLISIFKSSIEYARSSDFAHNNQLNHIKSYYEQDSGNKRRLLQATARCKQLKITPPPWVYEEIFEATSKILYDKTLTFEEALKFNKKDINKNQKQEALASMAIYAIKAGLSPKEAFELVVYDAYYILGWRDTKKKGKADDRSDQFYKIDTIKKYYEKFSKTLTDKYGEIFMFLFLRTSNPKQEEELNYLLAYDEWRDVTHKSRLEYYKNNIGKDETTIINNLYQNIKISLLANIPNELKKDIERKSIVRKQQKQLYKDNQKKFFEKYLKDDIPEKQKEDLIKNFEEFLEKNIPDF